MSPIVLENRKGGYYASFTAKLEKSFSKGFSGMIAYTHSVAKNLVDGAGDQASSAWNGNANVNGANSAELSYASYVTPNHFIAAISYRVEYLKSMGTQVSHSSMMVVHMAVIHTFIQQTLPAMVQAQITLSMFQRIASEITFVNQTVNGEIWTLEAQSDAFFAYIAQDKYLKSRQGKYAERNGAIITMG